MSNSASRLFSTVQALNGGDANRSAFDQWVRVLGLEESPTKEADAVAAMSAGLGEVQLVEQSLARLNAPPELFARAAKQLRHAFDPMAGRGAWKDNAKQVVEGHVNNPLEWAAWVIREFDQPDIDGPVLEALLRHIEAQERLLGAGGLTPYIHDMLQKQINDLRRALQFYAVQGSEPLKKAYNTAISELLTVPQDVAEGASAADAVAVSKARDVLAEAGKAAKSSTEILTFLSTWSDTASSAISYIFKLLPPPGP